MEDVYDQKTLNACMEYLRNNFKIFLKVVSKYSNIRLNNLWKGEHY